MLHFIHSKSPEENITGNPKKMGSTENYNEQFKDEKYFRTSFQIMPF